MIVLVTALLEGSHEGLQAVEINHDPVFTKSKRNQVDFDDTVKRIQRTAGVPIPIIFGDTASADALAAHLRHYHRNMKGIIPGTDRPYDAQGPALVLFAHVTIMHAALRIYENTPAPGRSHPPDGYPRPNGTNSLPRSRHSQSSWVPIRTPCR